jgi:hypothetical protein
VDPTQTHSYFLTAEEIEALRQWHLEQASVPAHDVMDLGAMTVEQAREHKLRHARRALQLDMPAALEPSKVTDPCLAKREPNEPMFTLLGRDPVAASLIRLWAAARERLTLHPGGKFTPAERIDEARVIAAKCYDHAIGMNRQPFDVLDLLPAHVLTEAIIRRSGVTTKLDAFAAVPTADAPIPAPSGFGSASAVIVKSPPVEGAPEYLAFVPPQNGQPGLVRAATPAEVSMTAARAGLDTGMQRQGSSLKPAEGDRWAGATPLQPRTKSA